MSILNHTMVQTQERHKVWVLYEVNTVAINKLTQHKMIPPFFKSNALTLMGSICYGRMLCRDIELFVQKYDMLLCMGHVLQMMCACVFNTKEYTMMCRKN